MTYQLDILDELKAIRALLEDIKARLPMYTPVPMPSPNEPTYPYQPVWYYVTYSNGKTDLGEWKQ
jgi:hypothetical protein